MLPARTLSGCASFVANPLRASRKLARPYRQCSHASSLTSPTGKPKWKFRTKGCILPFQVKVVLSGGRKSVRVGGERVPAIEVNMNKTSSIFVSAVAVLLFGLARSAAQNAGSDAKAAIDAAAAAMGTNALQSIQYAGTGQFYATGQAYLPGGPWPRYPSKSTRCR